MDIPKYLHILWSQKWLLLIGLVTAVVAGLFAGYTIVDGTLVSRVVPSYRAATTVLVGSASQPIFQAETPVVDGSAAPQSRDLTQTAVVYAYVVAGDQIRAAVEAEIGPLGDGETITAVRRTTQPSGDESSPGRFSLPILDVIGTAEGAERAELISRTATDAFQDYVTAEQDAADIDTASRVQLTTLDQRAAEDVTKSGSMLPVVVTGLGVLAAFIVAAFVVWNVRESRSRRRAARPVSVLPAGDGEATTTRPVPVYAAESR
ncbi:YveK family protein [Protaetiibacter intestinalis]|uniref:Polysaccharide chain length determinant N-terminal domain-containing protein n=1 Tax=Protaetiibacter intestinalis TaxID=2419774 RepID=A0A387B994_9MICO|nr:hypothetical protein [Protaetiibacter intestinalis]AYF98923.1 hypothetical protein D7I47_12105 [Protaetiibacter intestinalis]